MAVTKTLLRTVSTLCLGVALSLTSGCFSPEPADDEPGMGDSGRDAAAEGGADDPGSDADADTGVLPCEFQFYNFIAYGEYLPDLYRLHVSPSSAASWGADLLGDDVIVYGAGVKVSDIPGGSYDVRLVDEDGDTYSLYGVQCDETTLRWDVAASDLD